MLYIPCDSYFFEVSGLSEHVWNKPVLCIFKERDPFEVDPFVVVKARRLEVKGCDGSECGGKIDDFFTLMGDADYLSSPQGAADHYVMCWFDDTEPDMCKDLRRLHGVTFQGKVAFTLTESGKRNYNASFKAKHAKLK
jgi:hypothetical protein